MTKMGADCQAASTQRDNINIDVDHSHRSEALGHKVRGSSDYCEKMR
jgi:hypothetical protein